MIACWLSTANAADLSPEEKKTQLDKIRYLVETIIRVADECDRAEHLAVLEKEANPQQRRRYRMSKEQGKSSEECNKVNVHSIELLLRTCFRC